MPTVRVTTPQTAYDIVIGSGLLRSLYLRLRKLNSGKPPRTFVVTSPNIWGLWHKHFLASFPKDQQPTVLFLPAGERHKRLASVELLAQQLSLAGADRDSILLAFGGGVIGDVTGFLAAIYMRGIRYVGVPTTILAQVDSSLGGKTGVNLLAGKNLIGSFHHPLAVFTDIDLLGTLPAAELRSGLQEAIKAGIIYDPKLFRYMEQNAVAILGSGMGAEPVQSPSLPSSKKTSGAGHLPSKRDAGPDFKALEKVIAASVRVKADVVSKDEKESGLRMILNFGHTIGHAIEAATNYRKLLHGEAIAWGSIAALHVSLKRGCITHEEFARMANLILRYGPVPPFKIAATPRAAALKLVSLTSGDKKRRSGRRAFVLTTGVGQTAIAYDVTDAELEDATLAMLLDMRSN
ncbi:MAG TPA: 3-dehydroquinate synthase [Acidobacteriaceae bacterium]|nr:3-dehydroquinate synthase [Acidobacteriaceae bacterium]